MFESFKRFLKESFKTAYGFDAKNSCITLKANKKELVIKLGRYYKTPQNSSCVQEAYCLLCNDTNFGKLFIEYITLGQRCKWQSLAQSNFKDLIRSELKIENMKTVQTLELENYEICSFSVNEKYRLFTIVIYDGNRYTFILDYNGNLAKDIAEMFDKDIETLEELKSLPLNYQGSLTKRNMIENFISND